MGQKLCTFRCEIVIIEQITMLNPLTLRKDEVNLGQNDQLQRQVEGQGQPQPKKSIEYTRAISTKKKIKSAMSDPKTTYPMKSDPSVSRMMNFEPDLRWLKNPSRTNHW